MEKYYIGLDVGTNSVGWAVTDEKYNLVKAPVKGKHKNHDMWGIRLFEDAQTAEERRINRSMRRRLQRRKNRISLLQDIFKEEMYKVDETFFIRLQESHLHPEDGQKTTAGMYPLFNDSDYSDKEYYEQYPTVFHLRKDLIHNPKPHDIRMVYLALHNILKYRGNFLINGELSVDEQKDIQLTFQKLELAFDQYGLELSCEDISKVEAVILDKKLSKSDKAKGIAQLLKVSEKEQTDDFNVGKAIKVLSALLVGNKGDVKDLFPTINVEELGPENAKELSIKFSETKYEESQRDTLEELIPDELEVLDAIKSFYDWSVFVGIMGDHTYISSAKVELFNKHEKNLQLLKNLMKKYSSPKVYKDFFHNKDDKSKSYAAYVGMSGKQGHPIVKCTEEDFYKQLSNILKEMQDKVEDDDREAFERCKEGAENKDFLPTLRNKDNGSIPRQIHELELKKILDNARTYLPFLEEVDERYGKNNIEKIISIFEFRIPYYVGPLSTRHQKESAHHREVGSNVWIQRKEGMEKEKIYPWNFDDVVDKEKSNEEFIMRMTNKCTYLVGKDVLPQNSLLYQKYMVLNELNNLKINGEKISVDLKQELFDNLFRKEKKVTGKKLLSYLNRIHNMGLIAGDLTGFDQDFKSSLSSEIAFKKIFMNEELTDTQKNIAEDVIRWKTIYGDDKDLLEKVVKRYYPELKVEEVKKICQMPKMSGWGNFSKEFLTQVFCEEMFLPDTGEMLSIISALWETNENLMQLLSNRFGYSKKIEEMNADIRGEITEFSYEECVEGLFTSPSNKRAIWQTLQIVEEIKKVMGYAPTKIFVEMARGGGKKNKRTKSRKEQLIELYHNCEGDVRNWDYEGLLDSLENQEGRSLNSKKLFLYYLQNGKCAYTGEPINLQELMQGNTEWDIDHIFPQSRIDDDSFENLVLVKKKENAKKNNGLISAAIQNRMKGVWGYWLDKKFISPKKYSRLTKTNEFTPEELSGFIARQIVETRQSTKLIADVVKQLYPDTKVVYVKASLTSKFRQDELNVLKSRLINDYHHAKDAYLNIVVGDVYNNKYTDNPYRWIKEHKDDNYSITKTMYWDVKNGNGDLIWKGCDKEYYKDEKGNERCHYLKNEKGEIRGGDIDRIREIVKKDTCLYTEYTYCDKGQLFNASRERKGSKSAKIPLKKELSIDMYGGYKSANTSYFALVEFDGKKAGERVRNIVGVPMYVDNMLAYNPDVFVDYCKNVLKLKHVVVLKQKIKKNSLISVDGFPMRLRGETVPQIIVKGNLQLLLDENNTETVRLIEKFIEKMKENEQLKVSEVFDHINDGNLMELYDISIEKLLGAYLNRPANQFKVLSEKRSLFMELCTEKKIIVLNEILNLFSCKEATTSDLRLIGAGGTAGSMKISNKINGRKVKLIHQSVTGLFENKERL